MVVVVGAEGDRVVAALGDRRFERVESDPDAEQVESARLGLQRALELTGVTSILLHPADHPAVGAGVIDTLLRAASEHDGVIIPTHGGRGGHPVLVPATVARDITTARVSDGLRGYWRSRPEIVRRIEFPEAPELTVDLDTPEDYDATIA